MNDLIGKEVHVSLEPYYCGTARVVEVSPSHEHGKPHKLVPGYTTIMVEALDMTVTSRLLGHSSTKAVPVGEQFELHIYNGSFERMAMLGAFRYVYSV